VKLNSGSWSSHRSLLAGPLPSEIQSYITFTGGISANSQSIDAAKELMEVLKSPTAICVMRSQGMEPGK
jgi:molybdate transport system substrate-binding protein